MATQQVLFAETIAGMKKAFKRKAYGGSPQAPRLVLLPWSLTLPPRQTPIPTLRLKITGTEATN